MPIDPHHACLNWARWAESGDRHDLDAKISSLWRFWLPNKHRDDGWGDPGPAEAMQDPVDIQAAEQTDRALKHVAWQHYHTLRSWYYLHRRQSTDDLEIALEALSLVLNRTNLGHVVDMDKKRDDDSFGDSLALKTGKVA